MKITEPQVRLVMPKAKTENIKLFVEAFNKYSEQFEINTKMRVAHFLGQVAWESGQLNAVVENLNYSADGLMSVFKGRFSSKAEAALYARKPEKIANRVYANRLGNGSEASGDGWRYRGRGLIMITGKSNYAAYQNSGYCVGDLLSHPEWLAQYPGALKSAMWYWKANGCNGPADRDDGITVTERVNGKAKDHLSDRLYFTRVAKRVLCV